MKNNLILLVISSILTGLTIDAQTKQDSVLVEKACRDYVEGWAEGNSDRVTTAVSPELVKHTISIDKEGKSITSHMIASLLAMLSKLNKEGIRAKDFEPDKVFKLDVIIYDITSDFALAKTVNTKYGFFDYCQLAKFNGEW